MALCARRTADACCGEKFRESDLEGVDVPWFEQPTAALLCEDCLAESGESQEVYGVFNADEALRGRMEIGLGSV